MVLDSLLVGVMLFSSFAIRTPNVQPNPDDYEVSVGVSNGHYYINRQLGPERPEPGALPRPGRQYPRHSGRKFRVHGHDAAQHPVGLRRGSEDSHVPRLPAAARLDTGHRARLPQQYHHQLRRRDADQPRPLLPAAEPDGGRPHHCRDGRTQARSRILRRGELCGQFAGVV